MKKVYLLFLSILFMSCSDPNVSKYGKDYNDQRTKIGLPILPDDWKMDNKGKDHNGLNFIKWVRKYDGKDKPYHLTKTVVFNDTIVYEENQYVGINSYQTVDGTFDDELFITYNFSDFKTQNHSQSKGWECTFKNQSSIDTVSKMSVSIEQADSLLKIWGLSRK